MSKGIDIPIDNLVSDFTANLWTTKSRSFYGRVFRNERNGSVSPEIWITPNTYKEVLKDKRFDAQCFFDVQPNEPITDSLVHASTVWCCFMVNLATVYPTLTRTEATEKAHVEVEEIIHDNRIQIDGLIRGIEGFTGYDFGENSQAKADMSPHYLFRFNLRINYETNNC